MTGSETLTNILIGGSPYPTAAADRVYFDAADQADVYPFIVIHRVGNERFYGLDNSLHATKETFYIECWGETRAASQSMEAEVVAALAASNIPVSPNEPDGLDPEVKVLAAVVAVEIWT